MDDTPDRNMSGFEIKEQLPDSTVPYFASVLTAYKDGIACGSVSLYDNPYIEHNGQDVLLFGNVVTAQEEGLAMLISKAEEVARQQGKQYIIGPVNGSTWNDYRLPLTEAKALFSGDLAEPLFYAASLQENGYEILHRYFSAVSGITEKEYAGIEQLEGITIRGINTDDLTTDLQKLYPLCADAFSENVLFSPIDEATFVKKYLQYATLLNNDFVLVAEQDSNIIAFVFAYPDMMDSKRLVMKTIARHPQHRVPGLIDNMIKIVLSNAAEKGYTEIVHAFMHEANRSVMISERYNGSIIREYALFIKSI